MLVNISYHSAKVKWTTPSKLAPGSIIRDYHVKYHMMKDEGTRSYVQIGIEVIKSSHNKTYIELKNLNTGVRYSVKVKVIELLTFQYIYL